MKAVVKYAAGQGNIELRDAPEPKPADNEVKIKVIRISKYPGNVR